MFKFEINVELIGLGTANIPKPIGKVFFTNFNGKLHATTVIESRYTRKIANYKILDAFRLFDESILKLGFIYRVKITLSGRGYIIKKLFSHKYPFTTSTIFTGITSTIDHGKLAHKIALLDPKMNQILNKALAYYQAALETDNLYIKTMLLVSCVSSLIKDRDKIKQDLHQEDLVICLDEARRITRMRKSAFKKFIKNVYGLRSRPAHGNIYIKDKMKISESTSYEKLRKIVHAYIEKFLDDCATAP